MRERETFPREFILPALSELCSILLSFICFNDADYNAEQYYILRLYRKDNKLNHNSNTIDTFISSRMPRSHALKVIVAASRASIIVVTKKITCNYDSYHAIQYPIPFSLLSHKLSSIIMIIQICRTESVRSVVFSYTRVHNQPNSLIAIPVHIRDRNKWNYQSQPIARVAHDWR